MSGKKKDGFSDLAAVDKMAAAFGGCKEGDAK